MLAEHVSRPILVNRTYTLPAWVGRHTLVLACSYSGNTEETLSAAQQARRQGALLLAIASGGRLAAWARRHRIPLLEIPSGLPPRSALGYLAMAPLGLLTRLGWGDLSRLAEEVEAACRGLSQAIEQRYAPQVRVTSNPAKRMALILKGRLPILYGASGGWEGVAYRWRTQLEENAKTLAFHHLFPEATHNEISGWVHPKAVLKRATAVFLTDPAIHPRTLRRMEFTRRIIQKEGAQAIAVSVPGRHPLERLLALTALGDFASVYLGILYREDPTPVVRVEALKRYLARAGVDTETAGSRASGWQGVIR
jgi:glucose/mannose-6-phosphate isomerase